MTYADSYYVGEGEEQAVEHTILSAMEGNMLYIKKADENSLVYLDFTNIDATSFTVSDGKISKSYRLTENGTYEIMLHSDCTVSINGGSAAVAYKEVIRDYPSLIPAEYANDENRLHFNLWLTNTFLIEK